MHDFTDHGAARRLIREYHERMHPEQQDMTPSTATTELIEFRRMLFAEEAWEARDEFDNIIVRLREDGETSITDVTHLLHELADVVIVAYGTAMRLGVDLDAVVLAVMEANMQKQPNPTGGKAIKPPTFVPATDAIRRLVEQADEVTR